MKRICSIYKSPRKNEMYLYVLKADALTRVPEGPVSYTHLDVYKRQR